MLIGAVRQGCRMVYAELLPQQVVWVRNRGGRLERHSIMLCGDGEAGRNVVIRHPDKTKACRTRQSRISARKFVKSDPFFRVSHFQKH